jgi:hypothetical protein
MTIQAMSSNAARLIAEQAGHTVSNVQLGQDQEC